MLEIIDEQLCSLLNIYQRCGVRYRFFDAEQAGSDLTLHRAAVISAVKAENGGSCGGDPAHMEAVVLDPSQLLYVCTAVHGKIPITVAEFPTGMHFLNLHADPVINQLTLSGSIRLFSRTVLHF